ncbi:ATPase, T2SS/T4P/T4SS family, partial [Klebsiella pneumoniae]|uniref:ATPase, T2SS/T4P/T4SS family n=1 Tax=Klebsiella pneumoniae TaxID=573 RepID=UPI003F79F42B
VYEVVKITPKISELILQNAHAMDIENESRKEGFISLRQSGISKAIAGLTSIEEVMRVTSE